MAKIKCTHAALKALELQLLEAGCTLTPEWADRISVFGQAVRVSAFLNGKKATELMNAQVFQPVRIFSRAQLADCVFGDIAESLKKTQFRIVFFSSRTATGKSIQYCQLQHGKSLLAGLKASPVVEEGELAIDWQLRAAKELYIKSFISHNIQ